MAKCLRSLKKSFQLRQHEPMGPAKARKVLAALLRIGWTIKRQSRGSHRILSRPGLPDVIFAFHDREEIGPKMLAVLQNELD